MPFRKFNRIALGDFIDELMERIGEIIIAGGTIINGINAIDMKNDGAPLAPFLRSSMALLSRDPTWWAAMLICSGLAWLCILSVDMRRCVIKWRFAASIFNGFTYIALTVATMTGGEPKSASFRYMWAALWCFVIFLGTNRLRLSQKEVSK